MSKKAKIAIGVTTVFAVLAAVTIGIIVWILEGAYYSRSGGVMILRNYEDVRTVFGEDAMYFDKTYLDEIGFEEHASGYSVYFSGRNKTLKENKVTGYEEKADKYLVFYEGRYTVQENLLLKKIYVDYEKDADSNEESMADREYKGYKYYFDNENGVVHVKAIKNGHILYVAAFFEDLSLEEGEETKLSDEFISSCAEFLIDKIV